MKLISNTTIRLKGNHISESKVLGDDNKYYYVVVRFGNLLYATFDASLIKHMRGRSPKPNMIEGNSYLWFDINEDRHETRFWQYYVDCYNLNYKKEKESYIKRKYSRLKKPIGHIRYENISKEITPVFSCGPTGWDYCIKFHILDDDSYLYLFANDLRFYILCPPNEKVIESFEGFERAKKSKYYDLFWEMEKFIDGV